MCLPDFLFHSSLSHFSFEHQSPAHKHHLNPGLTFLQCRNKFPHTEIVLFSSFILQCSFHLNIFSISFLSVSSQICSFFFSSGTPSHTCFFFPQNFVWNIAGFWEAIHITSNTGEICWQSWNYAEISFKEAIRYPKAHSASVSRGKKQIHWLLFTVAAYKIPQIWQCISHTHFKSMADMLWFFPKHHQMHIPLEICPLNDLLLLNTFNQRRKEFWICYQKLIHYFTLQQSNMKNFITERKQHFLWVLPYIPNLL